MSTNSTVVASIPGAEEVNTALTPNNNAETTGASTSGGTTVNAANLTDGQRKMLQALGVDTNNITITAEMVACAEAKLGAARIEEIKNGATPSFSEGASLVACYH